MTLTAKLSAVVALVAAACGGKAAPNDAPSGGPLAEQALVQLKDAPPGLDLRVSTGQAGPPAFDRATLAPAKKLGDADTAQLLARAKPITADSTDAQAFALRPDSQPPPRTGATVLAAFPPPASSLLPPPPAAATGELRVLRYMPEGKVPIAPELTVTFSQPMVAITSQDDAARVQPVKLAPQPKGAWRWIGTRTIVFDPDVRFPMATTYTVEVPAGTKGTGAAALAAATRFTFETPPPGLVTSYPSEHQPQRVDVPMFLLFDQRVDAQAVLARLKVEVDGKPRALRLLDRAEIAKHRDKQFAALVDGAEKDEQAGRWVAFRTVDALPADSDVYVKIPAGTPSAEGPNVTTADQVAHFRTYPPLKLGDVECGYGGKCAPGTPFVVEFNNPLDEEKFDEQQLTVTPAIPDLHVAAAGNRVMIIGATKARTRYKVAIAKSVLDEFGQTLGRDEARDVDVGDAVPTFFGPQGMVVLDPAVQRRTLDFFSTNYEQLKVKLYKVTPADYDAWGAYLNNRWRKDNPPTPPGTEVFDRAIKATAGANTLVETGIDLKPALDAQGFGHAIAVVEPSPWTERWDPPRFISWVQATKLGLSAHVDADNLIAFVTDLDTGKPASGVAVELRPHGITAKTDARGLATIELGTAGQRGANVLLARRGADVAMLPEYGWYNEYGSWTKQGRAKNLAWYVVDDRKLYKPGEEVSLKGWLRTIDYAKHGDVGPMPPGLTSIGYRVVDSRGNELLKGQAQVAPTGGWDTKFTLPKTPNLGYATVQLSTGVWDGSAEHSHSIRIEEFRRPEFEVSAQPSQGPFLVGAGGDVTVSAKYYAGGPLAGAQTTWNVTASQTSFTPPNRDDYVFGSWTPWWGMIDEGDDDGGMRYGRGRSYKPPRSWQLEGKTDAIGAHTLHLDFLSAKPAVPMAVAANATVIDVNRQAITASAQLIVHPSQNYVGLKTKKMFVEKGVPFDIDVIGVDLDGKAVPGAKIEVTAVRLDWEYKRGTYATKEVDPQTCAVVAAAAPSPCSFATRQGGTYRVTATIVDGRGRPNTTKLMFWVAGGERPAAREVAQEKVELIPDKKEYTPGNTAEILAQAPFYPAEGLVTWRRSGIVKVERIAFTGPTATIAVPIDDAMTPGLTVQVDLVGAAARTDDKGVADASLPKRPAYAVGTITLPIPPRQRTLRVDATPSVAKAGPGERVKVAVAVADAAGKPVAGAEVAVVVVDESILTLAAYSFPDPIAAFYGARAPDARDAYSRAFLKLANPEATRAQQPAPTQAPSKSAPGSGRMRATRDDAGDMAIAGAAPPPAPAAAPAPEEPMAKAEMVEEKEANKDEGGKDNTGAIAIRSNFNPLAAFSPAVKTDAAGRATVEVALPDNLTRYRIVAIAAAGDRHFGKGESTLTARLPLMVRPSPPRFLNFGDTFRLPVVVQNQTDAPLTVRLAARATNAALTDGAGREVTVPANDRVEVQFPAAAELAGTARFQFVGTAGKASDAAEVALPVWTPATTEAFATYGVIDSGNIHQQVALPGKVVTQFGGVEVTTASTNLQALTDALLYLVRYPFECAEQRASRVLAIVALRDVLTAFKTKDLPSPAAMQESVRSDLERISQVQNSDGGFTWWERGRPSEPYLTVYVTSALAGAKAKGYDVPAPMLERAKQYLRVIEQHYPHYYSVEVRRAISAYALYTRKQLGDLDVAKAQQQIREAGGAANLGMETAGWLLATLAKQPAAAAERAAIVRHALNKVSETAGAANFTTRYGDGAYLLLASDRRVDAVMLEALIQEQKDLDLIPKLVTGLLAHRKAGRWLNTQENTFALLAMDLYFQTYEKATPNFVAKVWLGTDYAGERAFRGRSTDYFTIPIPMKDVAAHDKQDLTIQKDGTGRLYYRIGMRYAPASLNLEPADYGFVVERRYEGVDDPKDVVRQPDGTWKIKAGARVRVQLKLVNENRRYHVALVDPLPAGLEVMNPALATTGPIPQDPKDQQARGAYWWWYGPWYEHQNVRDERVEAFASLLWEGVHSYDYVARATTPGNFVVPPTKAEEMYMPETFGRGGSDRVVIE